MLARVIPVKRLAPLAMLLAALLAVPGPAVAGVYKCRQKDGKLVFRDEPCTRGKQEKFSLGATVVDSNPTGTAGDVSGSFGSGDKQVSFVDAMGFFHGGNNRLHMLFSPETFSARDIERYRKLGDGSLLDKRDSPVPERWPAYPFMELVLQFTKTKKPSRESLEHVQVRLHGPSAEAPLVFEYADKQARELVTFLVVFLNINDGDVQLEMSGNGMHEQKAYDFKALIRAPVYLLP